MARPPTAAALVLVLSAIAASTMHVHAIDDGLCRTPIMGMNSWTAYGASVTAKDLLDVGQFFVSSGLRDLGYTWINTDDGWDTGTRAADGKLQPDGAKFPQGIRGLVKQLNGMASTQVLVLAMAVR